MRFGASRRRLQGVIDVARATASADTLLRQTQLLRTASAKIRDCGDLNDGTESAGL
jgi:hypothetical protein